MARDWIKTVSHVDFPKWDEIDGVSGVYVIHLEQPLGHARHYIGYADNIARRVQEHLDCRGGRLLCAAVRKDIPFEVVRIYPGEGRSFEKRLKLSKVGGRYCPVCIPRYQTEAKERMRQIRARKKQKTVTRGSVELRVGNKS